jgi:toxin ParE1/3/4
VSLEYAPAALADIEEIADHIAVDSARGAERIVLAIHAKCAAIAESPLLYPLQDQFPGYRCAFVRPYGLWFRVDDGVVRIERVLHGARDIPAVLKT